MLRKVLSHEIVLLLVCASAAIVGYEWWSLQVHYSFHGHELRPVRVMQAEYDQDGKVRSVRYTPDSP